jgi:hypothetical protein
MDVPGPSEVHFFSARIDSVRTRPLLVRANGLAVSRLNISLTAGAPADYLESARARSVRVAQNLSR